MIILTTASQTKSKQPSLDSAECLKKKLFSSTKPLRLSEAGERL